jgi:hypothetical protein
MSDAVGTADKFLLGFFGYLVYYYGQDFGKTMIWDKGKEDKTKNKERREWNIDNSLLSIDEHIAEMNEKLSDIQKKVTLLEENTLFHIPEDKKFTHNIERGQIERGKIERGKIERGKIEYEEVDFGIHTPEVEDSG